MGAHALKARGIRSRFFTEADKDREELRAIEKDERLTAAARSEAISTINWRAKARYGERAERARKVLLEARADYDRFSPRSAQTSAAMAKPERAAAIKSMATGASMADLLNLAKLTAETKDLAGAHGLRLALAGVLPADRSQEVELGKVHAVLDTIAPAEGEAARADYLAAKIEYQRLLDAGPLNDPASFITEDPAGALTRMRTFEAMDPADGTLRNLTDADRTRFQELAGTLSNDMAQWRAFADTEESEVDGAFGTKAGLVAAHAGEHG
jgi:hypothetical protein